MPIVRPCPDSLDCPPDEPLDNFSSEGDDTLDFISTKYGYITTIDRLWNTTVCGVTYVSGISQADADMKATAAAQSCAPCLGADCPPNPGITLLCNSEQTACTLCPDGTSACFTVPAGTFCGFATVAEANQAASSFALLEARKNPVCISPMARCTCTGQPFTGTISANQGVTWSIIAGSLPPGIIITATSNLVMLISGTCNVPGTYGFQIRADNGQGGFTIRTYTITVLQITTTQLDAFSTGVPYSFQLQATGGSGNYLWKIVSGTLPPGLVMSNTGLISGTPL